MSASRTVKWGAAAVLLVAVTAFAYAGVGAAQGPSNAHWAPAGPTYNVTFMETGLGAGTNWSVALTGHWGWGYGFHSHEKTSNGTSITFSLPNGTYRFNVHSVRGYEILSGGHGFVQVAGAPPATVNVAFAKLTYYTATFTETGLVAGTHWTVRVSTIGSGAPGRVRSVTHTTSGSSMTFSLLNGTYLYHVSQVPGYAIADNGSHGTFNVTGASPALIHVVFVALPTYAVTFNETGLPAGTNWSVAVLAWNGALVSGRSDTSTITLELWNGTYLYHLGHVRGYSVNGGSYGLLIVRGASPPVIDVTFVALTTGGWGPTPLLAVV
jgi:hypothetical protein